MENSKYYFRYFQVYLIVIIEAVEFYPKIPRIYYLKGTEMLTLNIETHVIE